jgi:DNA-binding MarR family transcriptional regulator
VEREQTRVNATLTRCTLVHHTLKANRLAARKFGRDLFSLPAMEMLLELYVRGDSRPRSLTSLCVVVGASDRTALRIIHKLAEKALLTLTPDPDDARRVNVELTPDAITLLEAYFDGLLDLLTGPDLRG